MVHKATDGVPRLINQVCDHVLLLAYAAGIRRIEPAHVEEAWADLQQLPTPWNAPAARPPTGDSVIEFGGLDDGPLELPPIAGKIAAAEETSPAEADAIMQPTLVAETTRRPGDVRRASPHPEVAGRRAGRIPAGGDDRAGGRVGVRNAASVCGDLRGRRSDCRSLCRGGPAARAKPAACGACPGCCCRRCCRHGQRAGAVNTNESREQPQPEAIPTPHNREVASRDGSESEVAAATLVAVAKEPSPRPKRSVVPPPRQEFGRLFAKLRRGLCRREHCHEPDARRLEADRSQAIASRAGRRLNRQAGRI